MQNHGRSIRGRIGEKIAGAAAAARNSAHYTRARITRKSPGTRRAGVALALTALMIASLFAPFAGAIGVVGANDGPPGLEKAPNDNFAAHEAAGPPDHALANVPTYAAAWDVHASAHAEDLETTVDATGNQLRLVFSDDRNHAGREVAIAATALEDSLGERPDTAFGLHESGDRWSSSIDYRNGYAVIEIPKFSSNTVTFEGSVELTGSPASDGTSYSYELSDGEDASNLSVTLTGSTAAEWNNQTAQDVDPTGSMGLSVGGNLDPDGNSANDLPTVTVNNPATELEATLVDSTDLSGAMSVDVSGNYAYVSARETDQLSVVDISDPSNPSVVGSVSDSSVMGNARDVAVSGDYAYVSAPGSNSTAAIDVSDPTNPTVAGSVSSDTDLQESAGMAVSGSYVYIAQDPSTHGMTAVDVSDPTAPTIAGTITDSTNLRGALDVEIDADSNRAWVAANWNDRVTSVNISDPTAMSVDGTMQDGTAMGSPKQIAINGSYAYVPGDSTDTLAIVDISSPSSPSVTSYVSDSNVMDRPHGVAIAGDYAHVGAYSSESIVAVDVSDPTAATIVGSTSDTSLGTRGFLDATDNWVFNPSGSDNALSSVSTARPAKNLDISDDQSNSATVGTVDPGTSATVELAISKDATSLSLSGSGKWVDLEVDLRERVETENPEVEINGNTASHSGRLADGETTTLDVYDSYLKTGTNRVNVTVAETVDGPAGQVGLDYSHTATDAQSVDYEGETFSERYNVSKTYASDRASETLSIPWSGNVLSVRNLELRRDGGSWTTPSYTMSDGVLEVDIGSVSEGETVEIRTTGTKVDTRNGAITVVDPTVLGDELSSKIRIDDYADGFEIGVSGTISGNETHYTHSESWSNPQTHARVGSDGSQALRMPNAGAGETARISTIPLEPRPQDGHVDLRVRSAGSEPEFEVLDSSSTSEVDLVWYDTTSGSTYQLFSLTADAEVDRATANSPVSLIHDGSAEVLAIYDLGSGSGGAAAAGGTSTADTPPTMLIALALGGLLAIYLVSRRMGDDSVSGGMVLVAGSVLVGILSIQAMAPGILARAIGAGLESTLPILIMGSIAIIIVWLRSRGDDVTLELGGGRR